MSIHSRRLIDSVYHSHSPLAKPKRRLSITIFDIGFKRNQGRPVPYRSLVLILVVSYGAGLTTFVLGSNIALFVGRYRHYVNFSIFTWAKPSLRLVRQLITLDFSSSQVHSCFLAYLRLYSRGAPFYFARHCFPLALYMLGSFLTFFPL